MLPQPIYDEGEEFDFDSRLIRRFHLIVGFCIPVVTIKCARRQSNQWARAHRFASRLKKLPNILIMKWFQAKTRIGDEES